MVRRAGAGRRDGNVWRVDVGYLVARYGTVGQGMDEPCWEEGFGGAVAGEDGHGTAQRSAWDGGGLFSSGLVSGVIAGKARSARAHLRHQVMF